MILGLMSSEAFKTSWSNNARRRIFYKYPQGAAPLMALLSLLDPETTDKPEFAWFEKRWSDQRTTTAGIFSDGPFSTTGTDTPLTTAGWSASANTVIRVKTVANGTNFLRLNNVVWIMDVPDTAGGLRDIYGVVTEITASNKFEMRLLEAVAAGCLNTGAADDTQVLVIGSAFGEGTGNNSGEKWTPPIKPENFTQIFKTKFSFPRTALKPGVVFDKQGIYRDKAKENSLTHMMDMEKAFLFGRKTSYVSTIDGEETVTRTMGGFLYWLGQYEAQYSIFRGGNGVDSGPAALTADTDDDKRIISNSTGIVTPRTYSGWIKRAFRTCSNKAQEKLVLCGDGALEVLNEMYGSQTCWDASLPQTSTFGINVVRHQTPHGTVYYKSHPLFNENPALQNSLMFLDVHNMVYRALNDSDTTLLKNRQNPGADKRIDEWLTECGLEFRMPESHLFVKKITRYQP